jgi:hypothetical protein
MLLLLLDRLLESANGLCHRDFDRKGVSRFVALHDTIEVEGKRIRSCQRQRWMRNLMNQNKRRNRQRALTNGRSSYDDVEGLLEGFRMAEHFRQPACLGQCLFVEKLEFGHHILELLVDRDRFLKCTVVS